MQEPLPHLQFAVLSLINGTTAGRVIRDGLKSRFGIGKSGPTFYQLMSRLESDGAVKGRYVLQLIDNQSIKERVYSLTVVGRKRLKATKEFYSK